MADEYEKLPREDVLQAKAKQAAEYLARQKSERKAQPGTRSELATMDTIARPVEEATRGIAADPYVQKLDRERVAEFNANRAAGRPATPQEWVSQRVVEPMAMEALKRISEATYDRYKYEPPQAPTVMELDDQGNEVDQRKLEMQRVQEQLDSVRRARKAQEDQSTKGWTREQWLQWTEDSR